MKPVPIAGPWITQKEVDYVADAAAHAWYDNANLYHERFESAFAECTSRRRAISLPVRDCRATGVQAHLRCLGRAIMRNVAPRCLRPGGRLTVRQAVGSLGGEALRREGPAVLVGIPGATFPAP